MSEYKKKRESLIQFVKEQIVGPGAYNKRYHFKIDFEKNDFYNESLLEKPAFMNFSEVIPEVPAYQYSSAILFPQTRYANNDQAQSTKEIQDENEYINSSYDDENSVQELSESLISKQQNYPSHFGLSFVVNSNVKFDKSLDLLLSFRKYEKISNKSCLTKGLVIFLPEYQTEIEEIVNRYFSDFFEIIKNGNDNFLHLKKEILKNEFYDLDYICMNNYVKEKLVSSICNHFEGKLTEKKEDNKPTIYGIEKENEHFNFFSLGDKNYGDGYFQVYTIFQNSLINYIKKELGESMSNYDNLRVLICEIEKYNQLKTAINEFKSVSKSSLPIWQSKPVSLELSLPEYHGERVERIKHLPVANDYSDLEYSVQYSKIEKNSEKLFIKIIISNKSIVTLKEDEPPMLNKKDDANEKSYFGITLKVCEKAENIILNYNPPQMLDFDEEGNFNKLLYRKIRDYGEGYNTSVNWGETDNNFKYIETEFLPQEETPKVDYIPSKMANGNVVSRFMTDEFLSMRSLSTLSDVTNDEVINELYSFIEEYRNWIDEKCIEVQNEEHVQILLKQLSSCDRDYKRLKRNIGLLMTNPEALVAFRLMNTAMFMQLHQSIIKRSKAENLNEETNENYFKNLPDNVNYKWRSFQLAFIILNIDAFVKPDNDEDIVKDVFETGWPERNEIADLVWFPTGGGKTEAYLGIIAFDIIYRRFTKGEMGYGTTVLMRYTLRLLTLQQFQRATLLICALEVIRKDNFSIPNDLSLGDEKISIGLFVGHDSLPNNWDEMRLELQNISDQFPLGPEQKIKTKLPFTECPWCGAALFVNSYLANIKPNHNDGRYSTAKKLNICCNNQSCCFYGFPEDKLEPGLANLPISLFDDDIYKYPPTLLFGTVDKFAALSNNVTTNTSERNKDSRRFFGRGYNQGFLPPNLIIQDELHLLVGPLGTAVGLFEKAIDELCTYKDENNRRIKPKIITSTATTRNTDKQIFALFNRRSEIFPKQGITADDSFFAYYQREPSGKYISTRKYVGVLPVGKTQVWMQLRLASIALAHRIKNLKDRISLNDVLTHPDNYKEHLDVFDYYQTVLSYFNSLKEVGKTQSQLSHYLPGDLNYIVKNTIPWSFLDKVLRDENEINYSELTGRLSGEEVKTNLTDLESKWSLFKTNCTQSSMNFLYPPEFVISTNMISVGIDVSRFNTMIISSMPRNIAEYIQASSRVARDKEGVVFTVHHPFRSRDISHYQKFKEFHEKFYSYVEPISVTPFATKALDRYLAMVVTALIRHKLDITDNNGVNIDIESRRDDIVACIMSTINDVLNNSVRLNDYLKSENMPGLKSSAEGIISDYERQEVEDKTRQLINKWNSRIEELINRGQINDFVFRNYENVVVSLLISNTDNSYPNHWKVSNSLREIAPATVIKTVQQ